MMTEKQRTAAKECLKKARAIRAAKNPDSGIHASLRNLSKDHYLHPKKVKEWIKKQKDLMSVERHNIRNHVRGAIAKQTIHEDYIKDMERYLRSGLWSSLFYGEYQEHKVNYTCINMAYEKDGTPKRMVGIYYPDMVEIYTQEMCNAEKGLVDGRNSSKRSRKKRQKK